MSDSSAPSSPVAPVAPPIVAPVVTPTTPPDASEEKVTLTTGQLKARLDREREAVAVRFQKERDDEKAKADETALKERQEWQKLAEQKDARVKELEPQVTATQERYSVLAEQVNKEIDAAIKDWPVDARALVPTTDDVAARREVYTRVSKLLTAGTVAPSRPGTPRTAPRPTGENAGPSVEDQLRQNPRYQAF